VRIILEMGCQKPFHGHRIRWSVYFGLVLSTLLFHARPSSQSPLIPLKKAEFRNGFIGSAKKLTLVSGVTFSVSENGTTALCELSFSTDLKEIESASVSCKILYDNIGDSVTIGLTDHEWDFFAKIDDDVYEVDASITLNPTTEAIPKLILCFSETCSAQSSATTMMTSSALTMSSYCDCEKSALTMEEFSYSYSPWSSSLPEGFVFGFSGGQTFSSSSSDAIIPNPFTTPSSGKAAPQAATPFPAAQENTFGISASMMVKLVENDQEDYEIKNHNGFWTTKDALEEPLCLRYPPASSSSSSSSSQSSSSPIHSEFKYLSSSYLSIYSSSSSFSSSSPEHSPYISISSVYSSCSSSSGNDEGFVLIFGSSPTESSSSSSGCLGKQFEWSCSVMNGIPWSSFSFSSSLPEGFVINLGSEETPNQSSSDSSSTFSSSSSSVLSITTTAPVTNSQGSIVT